LARPDAKIVDPKQLAMLEKHPDLFSSEPLSFFV